MNQQEKDLFGKLLDLQTDIVDILIKIKGIETETVLQPELFLTAKVNPVADLTYFRFSTREFLKQLFLKFGFNEFNRKDVFVKDLIWQFRLTDFSKIIHELEIRNIAKIIRMENDSLSRINTIQFLKEIK
jgi:hypothetical protein